MFINNFYKFLVPLAEFHLQLHNFLTVLGFDISQGGGGGHIGRSHISSEDREERELRLSWHRPSHSTPLSTSTELEDLAPLSPGDVGDFLCQAENSVGRTERVFTSQLIMIREKDAQTI